MESPKVSSSCCGGESDNKKLATVTYDESDCDDCEDEVDSCGGDDCCKKAFEVDSCGGDDCCKEAIDLDLCGDDDCCEKGNETETCRENDSCGDYDCCKEELEQPEVNSSDGDDCCKGKTKNKSCEVKACNDDIDTADDCDDDSCCAPRAHEKSTPSSDCAGSCCDSASQDSILDAKLINNSYYLSDGGEALLVKYNSPCNSHLDRAMKEYLSFVKLGQCICSEMMKRAEKLYGFSGPSRSPYSVIREGSGQFGRRSSRGSCASSCCDPKRPRRYAKKDECSARRKSREDGKSILSLSKRLTEVSADRVRGKKISDLEEGGGGQSASFKVSGMTCTGCAKKVINVLEKIDGISAIEVTFVTSTVKFDHDPDVITLREATDRLVKETGFTYSHIKRGEHTLDIIVDEGQCFQKVELMVENIKKVSGNTYRVRYDPHTIGARDFLNMVPGASLAKFATNDNVSKEKRQYYSMLWKTIASAIFTVPVLVLAWGSVNITRRNSLITQLVLATVVQAIAVPEFYVRALKSLVYSRVLEMDLLVVISISAAYGYSVVALGLEESGIALEQEAIFETSTLLITLVLFGRLLTSVAKMKAVSAISMRQLQSYTSTIIEDGQLKDIDSRLLQFGDKFVVKAHSRIVTDGFVVNGEGTVDESMVTGESTPILKTPNASLIAGTMNGGSVLTAEVTRLPGDNSISDIADLVENALAQKPKIQDLADKIAGYFVPAVISIALIVFVIWVIVNLRVRDKNGGGAVGSAITYGIAVMAISCPCALGLAVPMVLVVAGGVAAKKGILIKNPAVLEHGFRITDVVLDKTGTLTDENMVVEKMHLIPDESLSIGQIKTLVKRLSEKSDHPMSAAMSAYLGSQEHSGISLDDVKDVPGSGIQGTWKNFKVKVGNPYWLKVDQDAEFCGISGDGYSYVCVSVDDQLAGVFCLKATLRPEAISVIEQFKARNITCHIVSGDNATAVQYIARLVGIPFDNIRFKHTPAEKLDYVRDLHKNGKNVLFCGDGINDAAAVTQANVGVQIGHSADLTLAAADVVLSGGLEGLVQILLISRKAYRIIMFNFGWAFVYNLVAILGTSGAFVNFRIPPAYAGVGEVVSVLPVILAAMSLAL